MKRIILCVLFLLPGVIAAAQPRVRVEEERNGNSVHFILENKTESGTLTVLMNFKDLYNCSNGLLGLQTFRIRRNNTRFLTLRARDEGYGVGYNYSWRCYSGVLDAQVDTAFVYRMPCSTLRPQRVLRTVYIWDKYRKSEAEQQRLGSMFPLEKGDTVYAMRRGVVTQVEIHRPKADEPAASFSTESTTLHVEHPDGSIAWYITLDPDNLFVEPGDEVFPSTPLALAGSYDGENYRVSVQVYRWVTNPAGDWDKDYAIIRYLFPRFRTTQGDLIPVHGECYTPLVDEEILTRELTRKELKMRHAGNEK